MRRLRSFTRWAFSPSPHRSYGPPGIIASELMTVSWMRARLSALMIVNRGSSVTRDLEGVDVVALVDGHDDGVRLS